LQSFRFASQWPKYWLHPSFVVLAKFIASNPDEESVIGASNTSVLDSGMGLGAGICATATVASSSVSE
jgi:hypothetical protein